MISKKIMARKTPKELGVKGQTAREFLLDLVEKAPAADAVVNLANGCKLNLARSYDKKIVEINFPEGREISSATVEKILKDGIGVFLEDNRSRTPRESLNVTMNIGDNTVYFTNGHLPITLDGSIAPMDPIFTSADNTLVRVMDTSLTQNIENLEYNLRKPHNQVIGWQEDGDNTENIANVLGFKTIVKKDSRLDVEINGDKGPCLAERLCIHPDEIGGNDEEIIARIMDTYGRVTFVDAKPLVIVGLTNLISVMASRNRRKVTLEIAPKTDSAAIDDFAAAVLDWSGISVQELETADIEYSTTVMVEESFWEKLWHGLGEKATAFIDKVDDFREKYGAKVGFAAAFVSISLLSLFFDMSHDINPTSSFFVELTAILPPVILAILLTSGRRTVIETYGQKRFSAYIWFWSAIVYLIIKGFGFPAYLKLLEVVVIAVAVALTVIFVIWLAIEKLAKPAERLFQYLNKITGASTRAEAFLSSRLIYFIGRILAVVVGVILAAIYTIVVVPIKILYIMRNVFDKGYWTEVKEYRETVIERSITKFRADRGLSAACRVRFKPSQCKQLKNPLAGGWKVLSRKFPEALTFQGFVDINKSFVTGQWV